MTVRTRKRRMNDSARTGSNNFFTLLNRQFQNLPANCPESHCIGGSLARYRVQEDELCRVTPAIDDMGKEDFSAGSLGELLSDRNRRNQEISALIVPASQPRNGHIRI